MSQNFTERFEGFMVKAQERVAADYAAFGGTSTPELSAEYGRRYIRIVSSGSGSRSAWGFVDYETGDVLKAAPWKTPAKNFARGNIFDAQFGLGRARWTGVA